MHEVRHRPGGQRGGRRASTGFTLPGDVSGSDKYYAEDIVEPPIRAHDGAIRMVDAGPGLGVDPIEERIEASDASGATLTLGV